MTNEETPNNNEETPHGGNSHLSVTPRLLDFVEEGPMPAPEEHGMMLQKWREDMKAKGKEKENARTDREAERLAKKKEADMLRLQALHLQIEVIELQEKVLREALEAESRDSETRRDKQVRDDQEESSDSESYSHRSRSKVVISSDLEDEGPHMRDRLQRMEKAMFGKKRINHESVVTEDIEQYRSLPVFEDT